MERKKIGNLIHNAVLAVIFAVVPFLCLLSAYPVVVAGLMYSMMEAVIVAGVSLVFYAVLPLKLYNLPVPMYMLVMVAGLSMLKLIKKKMNALQIITVTSIIVLGGIFLLYGDYLFDYNQVLSKKIDSYFQDNQKLLETALADAQYTELGSGVDDVKQHVLESIKGLPGTIAGLVVVFMFFNYYIIQTFACKHGKTVTVPLLDDYRKLRLSEWMVWGVIAGLAAVLFLGDTGFYKTGLNCFIFFSIVYMIQGVAISRFFFNKWKFPVLLQSLVLLFIFFTGFIMIFVVLGVSDVWFDLRKLASPAESPPGDRQHRQPPSGRE